MLDVSIALNIGEEYILRIFFNLKKRAAISACSIPSSVSGKPSLLFANILSTFA
jgi:hypothetical protein